MGPRGRGHDWVADNHKQIYSYQLLLTTPAMKSVLSLQAKLKPKKI
jgi:hypothetical protein